jgi:hypothetical protein
MVAPHEEQAYKNHRQSLKELASRQGLDVIELFYVLRNESFPNRSFTEADREAARNYVRERVSAYEGDSVCRYIDRIEVGKNVRADALFEALQGEPAKALRAFLRGAGFEFNETRLFSGYNGASLWAVGSSKADGFPLARDVTVEFEPQAIVLARLLAIVMNASLADAAES